jgi:hypothetical protein
MVFYQRIHRSWFCKHCSELFQFDGGARGDSACEETSSRDLEWRGIGRKGLGHDICGPSQKMEQETRGLVEALRSSHDLCGS